MKKVAFKLMISSDSDNTESLVVEQVFTSVTDEEAPIAMLAHSLVFDAVPFRFFDGALWLKDNTDYLGGPQTKSIMINAVAQDEIEARKAAALFAEQRIVITNHIYVKISDIDDIKFVRPTIDKEAPDLGEDVGFSKLKIKANASGADPLNVIQKYAEQMVNQIGCKSVPGKPVFTFYQVVRPEIFEREA